MNLRVIQVGKTKKGWLSQGVQEYLKRLGPLQRIEVLEVPDASLKTAGSAEAVKAREAERILRQIDPRDHVVLLDERGKAKTSLEFSSFLDSLSGRKPVVFVIGGVYGAGDRLKERANDILRLSAMTLTHQMARLFLIEQIYRALMIKNNRPYHY